MAGFDTDPAELLAAQAQLGAAADQGRVALARLTTAADDVFEGGWTGQAAGAFGRGWAEWCDGARRMLAALDELADAYGVTGREYAVAEQANVLP